MPPTIEHKRHNLLFSVFFWILIAFFILEIVFRFILYPFNPFGILPQQSAGIVIDSTEAANTDSVIMSTSTYSTMSTAVVQENENTKPTPSRGDTDVAGMVIGIIGLLSLFGAVLAYVFKFIVKQSIEDELRKEWSIEKQEIQEEWKKSSDALLSKTHNDWEETQKMIRLMAKYERDRSKLENHRVASFIFTKLAAIYPAIGVLIENRKKFFQLALVQDYLAQSLINDVRLYINKIQQHATDFDNDSFDKLVLTFKNYTAFHIAELGDIKHCGGDIDIQQSDIELAKKITAELRESMPSIKNLFGADTYRFYETCTWVDFIFSTGKTEEEVKSMQQLAYSDFKQCKLVFGAPDGWYEEFDKKYSERIGSESYRKFTPKTHQT